MSERDGELMKEISLYVRFNFDFMISIVKVTVAPTFFGSALNAHNSIVAPFASP